jgi:hypothetical protein
MKTLIFAVVICGLLVIGCSTTTYLNLKATYPEYIEEQLNKVERDTGVGVEVSLLLNNGNKVNGELLSVGDSTMILCSEYSATEEELAKLTYPVLLFSNNEIQELTIEGSNWIWEGIAAGAAVGGLAWFAIMFSDTFGTGSTEEEGKEKRTLTDIVLMASIGAGWGIGYALSTEEYILQEIPPDYNWSILKPLARYPDEEPEYINAIK